jgi:hypothetical protein
MPAIALSLSQQLSLELVCCTGAQSSHSEARQDEV